MGNTPTPVNIKIGNILKVTFESYMDDRMAAVLKELRKACTFTNPAYLRQLKMGRTPYRIAKYMLLYRETKHGIYLDYYIDRGFYVELIEILKSAGLEYNVEDVRTPGNPPKISMSNVLRIGGGSEEPLVLRDDQKRLLKVVLDKLNSPNIQNHQGIIVAPTGSGKTIIALELIREMGVKTIVLVHTTGLADQWREEIEAKLQIDSVLCGHGKWPTSYEAEQGKVIVVLAQTVMRNIPKWTELVSRFGMLILDETHHAPAHMWRHLAAQAPCKYRIGLSATPYREDGLTRMIDMICGKKLEELAFDEVMAVGGVVPVRVCPYQHSISNILSFDGWTDFLTFLVQDDVRNRGIVGMAARASKTLQVLLLTDRVDHAIILHEMLMNAGVDSVVVHGQLSNDSRKTAFARMETSAVTVGTTGLLGEGIDVPGWCAGILALPMSARAKTLQAIGRITRPIPGKKTAWIADVIDDHPMGWGSWKKRRATYRSRKMTVDEMKVLET